VEIEVAMTLCFICSNISFFFSLDDIAKKSSACLNGQMENTGDKPIQLQGNYIMMWHKFTPCIVCKGIWNSKEDKGKSMFIYCGFQNQGCVSNYAWLGTSVTVGRSVGWSVSQSVYVE